MRLRMWFKTDNWSSFPYAYLTSGCSIKSVLSYRGHSHMFWHALSALSSPLASSFSPSSVGPPITATLTSILLKGGCLPMSCQAGIKTSEWGKDDHCLQNQEEWKSPQPNADHFSLELDTISWKTIREKKSLPMIWGWERVGAEVVLNYKVLFRCCELFMCSIFCFSQMLKAVLVPSSKSEPFLLKGHHLLGNLLFHPYHSCLI